MDTAEGDIAALGDTIYYFTTFDGAHPTYSEVLNKLNNGYLPAVKTNSGVFLYNGHTNSYIDFIAAYWDNAGEPATIYGKRLNANNPGALQNITQTIPTDDWIQTLIDESAECLVVNVTGDQNDPTRPASADKTWTEIWTAITEKKEVICIFNYAYFRYLALGADVTFPLIFGNSGAYTNAGRLDSIQVNSSNVWTRNTIAIAPAENSAIQTGDKLVIGRTDANGDKLAYGSALSFDKSAPGYQDYYLNQYGTFTDPLGFAIIPPEPNTDGYYYWRLQRTTSGGITSYGFSWQTPPTPSAPRVIVYEIDYGSGTSVDPYIMTYDTPFSAISGYENTVVARVIIDNDTGNVNDTLVIKSLHEEYGYGTQRIIFEQTVTDDNGNTKIYRLVHTDSNYVTMTVNTLGGGGSGGAQLRNIENDLVLGIPFDIYVEEI